MAKKIVEQVSEEELLLRNSKVKKRKLIYVGAWAVFMLIYAIGGIYASGINDESDKIFDIMMFVVPAIAVFLDFLYLGRYEKERTVGRFIIFSVLLTFIITYIGEALTVIIGFGLDTPQYKLLYTFALGLSIFAAIISLIMSSFYGMATGLNKHR